MKKKCTKLYEENFEPKKYFVDLNRSQNNNKKRNSPSNLTRRTYFFFSLYNKITHLHQLWINQALCNRSSWISKVERGHPLATLFLKT